MPAIDCIGSDQSADARYFAAAQHAPARRCIGCQPSFGEQRRDPASSPALPVVSSLSPVKIEFAPARKHSAWRRLPHALAPRRQPHHLRGIVIRATATVRTNSISSIFASGVSASMSPSTVPLTGTSALIGTLLRHGAGSVASAWMKPPAIAPPLAHADDPAAASSTASQIASVEPAERPRSPMPLAPASGERCCSCNNRASRRASRADAVAACPASCRFPCPIARTPFTIGRRPGMSRPWGCARPRPCRSARSRVLGLRRC